MDREEAKRVLEVILFVADKPLAASKLTEIVKGLDADTIKACVDELNGEYASGGRTFSIKEIAGGYQMLTDPIYSQWVAAYYKRPAEKLRGPALETLSIIAYKQPITRSQIEAIRGVNVDGVLSTLEERALIRTRGRMEGPGRPILYGTTNEFLQHFGLKSLDELPALKEFQETDLDFVKEQERSDVIDMATGKLQSLEDKAQVAAEQAAGAAAEDAAKAGPEAQAGQDSAQGG